MLRSLGFGPFRRSRERYWVPGVAIWADFEILEFLGGLVIYITRQVRQTTAMNHMATLVHMSTISLALGPRFGVFLGPQRRLLRLQGVAIWEVFEFLGGLVIYHSHHVNTNPEIKPYRYLCTYPSKDSSAWTEVWSIAWPSKASIIAPGGRNLGGF